MKLAQLKINWLTRLKLVVVMFVQGIIVANTCLASSASAVKSYSTAQQDDETMLSQEVITLQHIIPAILRDRSATADVLSRAISSQL
jgi:hypothetical protein